MVSCRATRACNSGKFRILRATSKSIVAWDSAGVSAARVIFAWGVVATSRMLSREATREVCAVAVAATAKASPARTSRTKRALCGEGRTNFIGGARP